jgi:hypothetical protein
VEAQCDLDLMKTGPNKLERRSGIPQEGTSGAPLLERAMRRPQKTAHDRVDETSGILRAQVLHPMRCPQRTPEFGACRIGDDFHELRALRMAVDPLIYSQGKRFRASNLLGGRHSTGALGNGRPPSRRGKFLALMDQRHIIVLVNGKHVRHPEIAETALAEGDRIAFAALAMRAPGSLWWAAERG